VTWIDDGALRHLRAVIDQPDLSGTRYLLLDTLGRGGMGTVYRARDTELDRDVALKVLSLPDPDHRLTRRIRAEAKILASLEHPGIVPVHDAGLLPDGRVFYVMKRVRGRRLDHLDTMTASTGDLVRTARRVCDPVAFAHAHGVIHRDLKPENVMIGDFGEVLVLDWGVAKVLGASASPPADEADEPADHATGDTATGESVGTPGYMAPEQQQGDAATADARADVYGTGAILFFLLCRRAPAGDGAHPSDDAAVRHALERRRPPLPRRLRAIVRRSLAADPAHRYPSIDAFAADLDRFLDGQPVAAHRENLAERTLAWISKYRTPVALVLTYIVLRIVFILLRR
jgi:serine/threonine protein kinase